MISSMVMAWPCATASCRIRPQYIAKRDNANWRSESLVPVRLVAAPGWLELRRRPGRLRGLAGRADGIGRLRAELLVEELVQHLGASLSAMADSHRGLRADAAGLGLTAAEAAQIADSSACGGHGLDGANLGLRCGSVP